LQLVFLRYVFRKLLPRSYELKEFQTWITATQAIHPVGCFKPDDTVLFHAGASAVSIAGIQLAKAAGAGAIFVTAGSSDKIVFCVNELGATGGFNYHTDDWVKGILDAMQGHGADVVIGFIGKAYAQFNLQVAAVDGRIAQVGAMSGGKLDAGLDISLLINERIRWEGTRLRNRSLELKSKLRDLWVEMALPRFVNGTFKSCD
jgi:NADPH:quinone reductase-like Zn-dependent oxidoreductase